MDVIGKRHGKTKSLEVWFSEYKGRYHVDLHGSKLNKADTKRMKKSLNPLLSRMGMGFGGSWELDPDAPKFHKDFDSREEALEVAESLRLEHRLPKGYDHPDRVAERKETASK